MSIKILTKNSIDNTNIDGARANHFSAGMRSGIVKGAYNEGTLFTPTSNKIALDSCELRISGHQVVIDSVETIELQNAPSQPTRMSVIAEIQVNDNSVPAFRLFVQNQSVKLTHDNLFKTNNGKGTYQLRIGNFTLGTTGLISDVVRTADLITGGGEGGIADIKFNATATQLSSSSQPEVNADYNEETKEWDLHFGIPAGSGSNVTIGGVVQPTWSADFAESERQKSKNLFDKDAVLVGYELVGNTGETNPLSDYWASDYIKIQGMANLYVSGENRSAGQSFCYYDENKTYISTERKSGGVGLLTPPSSAVYLRCNGLLTQLDGVQIEEGTVATSYQPYNGEILHKIDIQDLEAIRTLPSEYQEVEYIESTGTQYIDTGVKNGVSDVIKLSMSVTTLGEDVSYYASFPSVLTQRYRIGEHQGKFIVNAGQNVTGQSISLSVQLNTKYDIELGLYASNQYLKINDEYYYNNTLASLETSAYSAYIFGRNNNGVFDAGSSIKLYGCSIIRNNVVIRDYKPCYRKHDGEIGLYDLANNVFYTNNGTGEFLRGKNVYLSNVARKTDVDKIKNLITSNNVYDLVISTQEQFTEFYNSIQDGTLTATSILFVGDGGTTVFSTPYAYGYGAITLPLTVRKIDGIRNAKIKCLSFGYSELPPDDDYSISGLEVYAQALMGINHAFSNMRNVTNCRGNRGTFYNCKNVINCYSVAYNVTNFQKCENLVNCTAVGEKKDSYIGDQLFRECKNLLNCSAEGEYNYAYYMCNYSSNCSATGTVVHDVWGGQNLKRDDDSCTTAI